MRYIGGCRLTTSRSQIPVVLEAFFCSFLPESRFECDSEWTIFLEKIIWKKPTVWNLSSKLSLYFQLCCDSQICRCRGKKKLCTHLEFWHKTIKASHSAQSALFLSHQHVKKQDASSSEGGGGDDDGVGLVWEADRWAIDLPQHITPAPFTEAVTSPADWCADNWAVTRVFMFLLQVSPDFSYCIVFYFNTIYNKGHPDVYLCQYPARLLSGRQRDANSCTGHDRPLACLA